MFYFQWSLIYCQGCLQRCWGQWEPMGAKQDLNICCWSSKCYLVLLSPTGFCRGAGCLSHTQTVQNWVSSAKFATDFVLWGSTEQLELGLGFAGFSSISLPAGRRTVSFEKFWRRAEARVLGVFVVLAAEGCGPGTCHSVSSARCAPAARGPRAGAAVSMAAAILSSR